MCLVKSVRKLKLKKYAEPTYIESQSCFFFRIIIINIVKYLRSRWNNLIIKDFTMSYLKNKIKKVLSMESCASKNIEMKYSRGGDPLRTH